jgi:phosphoglycerate dehydrogenase-like enzyme
VHTSAVAVETLALADLFARNIIVSNSRGVQATPIAEHVFAVLLALAKQAAIHSRQSARAALGPE